MAQVVKALKKDLEQPTAASPIAPVVSAKNEPIKYHNHGSCNSCGGSKNRAKVTDSLDGRMLECKTECEDCGFTDYWAHGFFESSQYLGVNCKTYSFAR